VKSQIRRVRFIISMADTKTTNLSRLVLKQAGRAKEKILQNLGKSDKTTDEIFEEHLSNFNAQQVNATRLHKDINNYLRCIRAMQTASKNLMDTLSDIYEKEWIGQDMLHVQAQNNEMLWADLAHKLTDQVVTPLNTYQAQFPEMRKKIDKRGRKLIDYDAERHNVQTMQNNPNRNEAKYIRAKEQMENAKRTYEVLNSELHDELPALYDSRVIFLVTNMQTLFAAEEVFHSETSKVFSELESVVDKLAKEVQRGTLPRRSMHRALPLEHSSPPVIQNSSMNSPPKGASTDNMPPGVLYQVKAAYKYQAEDVDELSFEVGEVVQVIEYEDPEEQQEEGWLMGVKEYTGQKGLFPANFTRPM
jgi:amphiphysin